MSYFYKRNRAISQVSLVSRRKRVTPVTVLLTACLWRCEHSSRFFEKIVVGVCVGPETAVGVMVSDIVSGDFS